MRCTMQNHQMMTMTFGFCANAASFCAKILSMDAIFVASILIICGLICGRISLSILGIALVLLAVLVLGGKLHRRAQRLSVT